MPGAADLTQFDLGRSVGLWVSAFEILIHQGPKQRVGLTDVYDQLEAVSWGKKARPRRYKPHNSKIRRNLACWIYDQIYGARNDFMHGNPVDRRSLTVKSPAEISLCTLRPFTGWHLPGFCSRSRRNCLWRIPISSPEIDTIYSSINAMLRTHFPRSWFRQSRTAPNAPLKWRGFA
jgi:hypothetical protein